MRGQVAQRDHDRRLADDPVLAVDELGELRQRLQAVAGVRLRGGLLGALLALLRLLLLRPSAVSSTAVPIAAIRSSSDRCAYQMSIVRICGELGHRLPVGRSPTQRRRSRVSALVNPLLRPRS